MLFSSIFIASSEEDMEADIFTSEKPALSRAAGFPGCARVAMDAGIVSGEGRLIMRSIRREIVGQGTPIARIRARAHRPGSTPPAAAGVAEPPSRVAMARGSLGHAVTIPFAERTKARPSICPESGLALNTQLLLVYRARSRISREILRPRAHQAVRVGQS